jgi:hypothetical protein
MGMGMNGFSRRSRTKQLGDLRVALGLGLGGKGKILAVGLALTSESGLKVVLGGHCQLPFWFDLFAVSYITEASSPIHQVPAGVSWHFIWRGLTAPAGLKVITR